MKTLYVFIFSMILCGSLFLQSANGQWYNKKYGVASLSELNKDQYNSAMANANGNIKTGKTLTTIGSSGIVAGGAFYAVGYLVLMNSFNSWDQFFSGLVFSGLMFTSGILIGITGIITNAIGIPTWAVGAKRKSDINNAFGNSFSQISLSPNITWHHNKSYLGAKISFPIGQK